MVRSELKASNTQSVPKYQNSNPLFVLLPNTQSNITTWRLKCLFYGLLFIPSLLTRSLGLSLSVIYYLDIAFTQKSSERKKKRKKLHFLVTEM